MPRISINLIFGLLTLIIADVYLPLITTTAQAPQVLVGAGDIASCTSDGDEATAALLDTIPGTVFTTGDMVYPDGAARNIASCYAPSWGRHKARTRPAAGNHEYDVPGAAPYYDYFGAAAGDRTKGYYSYNLGAWHIVVLNSNCDEVGGCGAGSAQERWLRADLAANRTACTVAYWHHPRFSSTAGGGAPSVAAFWAALYAANADVVLNGHDHFYERYAPQSPSGAREDTRGIRQITIGSGGASFSQFAQIAPNSQVRNADTFGVLKLTLRPTGYDWAFVPEAGKTFKDSGTASCHNAAGSAPAAAPAPGLVPRMLQLLDTLVGGLLPGWWRFDVAR